MICTGYGDGYVPEKYKDYKNRTIKKHLDKAKNQLSGIKQCSLKKEDKDDLIKQIKEMFKQ